MSGLKTKENNKLYSVSKRKIERLFLFILFFLLIMFFARGPFYKEGAFFARMVIVLLLGISTFFLVKTLFFKYKSAFCIYYFLLLLLNVISYTYAELFSDGGHFPMFIGVLIGITPFFPAYYFSRKGILTDKHLIWFFIILLPVIIAKYYYLELQVLVERSFSVTGITNNYGYYFVTLIPFLFLFRKKKIITYILSFVLFYFIISSAKRGAILVGGVGLICFLYFQLRTAKKKEFIITIILVMVASTILMYYGYEYIQENEYLLTRLEATSSGDSSGRDIIYKNIFTSWFKTPNLCNFVFGFGFSGSLKLSQTGHVAHNDWLELLSNFGLIGILLYGLLFYSLFSFIRLSSLSIEKKILLSTICLMLIITSVFSMVYMSSSTAMYSLLIAYIIGDKEKNILVKNKGYVSI